MGDLASAPRVGDGQRIDAEVLPAVAENEKSRQRPARLIGQCRRQRIAEPRLRPNGFNCPPQMAATVVAVAWER